jgi:hypothetical protein
MTASEILAALAAPFDPAQVSWRVGSMSKDKSKAKALAYIDARDVMRRLDEVMGADWQCEYVPMPNGTTCCKISLRIDGEWRSRSNGAGATDIEGEKGGFSDAFKRAAVLWGVGQYLYDVDSPWVRVNEWKQIDDADMPRLRGLLAKQNPETRAHERAPARQEPAPQAASAVPAPVDPKKEALDRQTAHATRVAELQRSKQEDAKAKAKTFAVALSGFKNQIEGGDVPAFEVRRNYNTWLQTLKASWSSLLIEDQRTIKATRDKLETLLREAEVSRQVAA